MRKLLVALAFTAFAAAAAQAQTYPSRPVTLIVPYPAGGPSDTLARVLAEAMRSALGQTVIIENVSGAGGSIGTGRVARSAPDGYMLSLGHVQTHVLNGATQNLNYDVVKDFEPVTLIADTPTLDRGARRFPRQGCQGNGRLDEGKSGQGDGRQRRRRRAGVISRRSTSSATPERRSRSCPTRVARR